MHLQHCLGGRPATDGHMQRALHMRDRLQALSDAHSFLFEERQRLLALQADNDELRLQEIEDRRNIQQLLVLQQAPGRPMPQPPGPSVDQLMLRMEALQAQLDEQARQSWWGVA